jgi:hypothetical protein
MPSRIPPIADVATLECLNRVQLEKRGFWEQASYLWCRRNPLSFGLVMLRVESARWGQTPADLRRLATSAPHPRTRERFLALYEITQESCATRIAGRTHRHPQTVLEWLHLYNTRGPEALTYQRTGGRPPFAQRSKPTLVRRSVPPNDPPQPRP